MSFQFARVSVSSVKKLVVCMRVYEFCLWEREKIVYESFFQKYTHTDIHRHTDTSTGNYVQNATHCLYGFLPHHHPGSASSHARRSASSGFPFKWMPLRIFSTSLPVACFVVGCLKLLRMRAVPRMATAAMSAILAASHMLSRPFQDQPLNAPSHARRSASTPFGQRW